MGTFGKTFKLLHKSLNKESIEKLRYQRHALVKINHVKWWIIFWISPATVSWLTWKSFHMKCLLYIITTKFLNPSLCVHSSIVTPPRSSAFHHAAVHWFPWPKSLGRTLNLKIADSLILWNGFWCHYQRILGKDGRVAFGAAENILDAAVHGEITLLLGGFEKRWKNRKTKISSKFPRDLTSHNTNSNNKQ